MEDELCNQLINMRINREYNHNNNKDLINKYLQISLIWNDPADLDLLCIVPSGEEIDFSNKKSNCGGELDIDMNASISSYSLEPVENIIWKTIPCYGNYRVYVKNFNNRVLENTIFNNSNRNVKFKLRLIYNGKSYWFENIIGSHEKMLCFNFVLNIFGIQFYSLSY